MVATARQAHGAATLNRERSGVRTRFTAQSAGEEPKPSSSAAPGITRQARRYGAARSVVPVALVWRRTEFTKPGVFFHRSARMSAQRCRPVLRYVPSYGARVFNRCEWRQGGVRQTTDEPFRHAARLPARQHAVPTQKTQR